jgi:HEAT repeat protein
VGLCVSALVLACHQRDELARKHLLARLRDARPAARIVAIRDLSRDANQEETVAIARAAKDAPEEVRREVALALGRTTPAESVDLLGAMVRDPADSVKAAAIQALESKNSDRVGGYIVAAYQSGGPLVRNAVADGRPELFRRAVVTEAIDWRRRIDGRRKDSHTEVRSEAFAELGRDATIPVIAELTARLVDNDPVMAAAAAAGLANARATDEIPSIAHALQYPSPLVVDAAAIALRELGAQPAVDALAAALEKASDDAATHILDALQGLTMTPAARDALCRVATGTGPSDIALRAARLVSTSCEIPLTLPAASKDAASRLLILAAFGRKNPQVVHRARQLLGEPDTQVAAAAATYLARCGEKSDGALLVSAAQSELARINQARADKALQAQEAAARKDPLEQQFEILRGLSGPENAEKLQRSHPQMANKLAQLIASRHPDVSPLEGRPGSIALIQTLANAADVLGGDLSELVASLLADPEPSIRIIVCDFGRFGPDGGQAVRAKLRQDVDPEIRLRAGILDLNDGQPGTLERLADLTSVLDPNGRARLASALATHAADAKPLLLTLLGGADAASPLAAQALATLPGEDVDRALAQTLRDRPGSIAEASLTAAAVSPSPDVREAALDALVARKACGAANRLAPLDGDFSGAVRAAAAALKAECSSPH